EACTLALHDALPIFADAAGRDARAGQVEVKGAGEVGTVERGEERRGCPVVQRRVCGVAQPDVGLLCVYARPGAAIGQVVGQGEVPDLVGSFEQGDEEAVAAGQGGKECQQRRQPATAAGPAHSSNSASSSSASTSMGPLPTPAAA